MPGIPLLFLTLLRSIRQQSLPTECSVWYLLPNSSCCFLTCHQSVISSLSERQQPACGSFHIISLTVSEKGAPALFQSWVTELLTKYLGVSWWGSGTHPVFLILEPLCLSALLFWLVWVQVSCCCCLVQGLFPFKRTFLFFPLGIGFGSSGTVLSQSSWEDQACREALCPAPSCKWQL